MQIECDFTYEAAHRLPKVPPGHKCGRMHGHSYHLTVFIEGKVEDHTGWVIDFADVRDVVAPVIAHLDHHTLNDILDNPTVENQLIWLWERIAVTDGGAITQGRLKGTDVPVRVVQLTLSETPRSRASYRGPAA